MATVHLEGADLSAARLEGACLSRAHLEGADLTGAHLERAALWAAHLEGTDISGTYLAGTNMRRAYLDSAVYLNFANLSDAEHGAVLVADARWNAANLATVGWSQADMLGDERAARQPRTSGGKRKDRATELRQFEWAVRANRQLAQALQQSGVNEEADRFAYRAQLLQREVLRRQGHWLRYAGSVLLDLISGYGYRPVRSLITYVFVVAGFALAYYLLGPLAHLPLEPQAALIFSVTSFHGRGFAPGANVGLTNPLTELAALEAIIGLLIEITFIATFTQRFFAR